MTTPAFKEWAIIVESLGKGMQCLVLRKGGIHEGKGGFQPEHKKFWLLPTGFHQHADKVKPEIAQLDKAFATDPIPFRFIAESVETFKVTDLDKALALAPFHFWKDSVTEERFKFGKWEGLYAMLLKVYRVDTPVSLPNGPEFGGCKSWIDLPVDWPHQESLKAVMDGTVFEEACEGVRRVLR